MCLSNIPKVPTNRRQDGVYESRCKLKNSAWDLTSQSAPNNWMSHQKNAQYPEMYKVAVVDDDEHWCQAIKRFFRYRFDVTTFTDPECFVQRSQEFDLVLVDFVLLPLFFFEPIHNGYELVQFLKRHLNQPPLMVLVSGMIDAEDHYLFPEADACVIKTVDLDDLEQQMFRLLSRSPVPECCDEGRAGLGA